MAVADRVSVILEKIASDELHFDVQGRRVALVSATATDEGRAALRKVTHGARAQGLTVEPWGARSIKIGEPGLRSA